MNEKIHAITIIIDTLATEIIESLRRKIINEPAFVQLYTVLDDAFVLIEHEEQIDRELAALLFLVYSQLVTQSNYVYDKSPFVPHIGKMQGMIRKIFGATLQNI
ncbi:hypothetical protein PAECIP111892_01696 [Paenibacillus auburnensis]|jgi:hypothetical protein|uniref:Uncharacterized protein n=1 Tax=Paenibacillus auburnensis TaxID=2905649 RepID=A0ABM9BTR2_9BACL|nr:hypothetical protein [Paenibacillus auburnensis]CAH1194523.1 hypothetical protein PAECIP111892_01696 [Paenibacillus auburnensis]